MWIRLTGHPIAFPAFAGEHPQVYMDTANNAVRILAGLESGSAISAADNPMRWFYDFRFSDDRTQMALVSKQV